MNFGEALDAMKRGEKVSRRAWNGWQHLYINEEGAIRYYDGSSKDEKIMATLLTSDSLLANDWTIKVNIPEIGDIVLLQGVTKGIITKCRTDGKYTVMLGNGDFLVRDLFDFTLYGENYRGLIDDINLLLNDGE